MVYRRVSQKPGVTSPGRRSKAPWKEGVHQRLVRNLQRGICQSRRIFKLEECDKIDEDRDDRLVPMTDGTMMFQRSLREQQAINFC